MGNTMLQQFKAARRVSTPLVAIETPDAAATIDAIRQTLTPDVPVIQWDGVRGLRALNDAGAEVPGLGPTTVVPPEALIVAENVPGKTIIFMHNAHRLLSDINVVQALWNLRDLYKVDRRMIVLLGPSFQLPTEIAGDVITLVEPLPTRAELNDVLDRQYENAKRAYADLPALTDKQRMAILDAIVGLPQYTAEQIIAMAFGKTGVDVPSLWDYKKTAIQNTDGLRVWSGDTPMEDLQGIDNVVAFSRKLIRANAFNAIVFIDEGDKALAGGMSDYSGDSGVSKDQVGTILTYIEDTGSRGMLLAGLAGTGKSQLVKAIGQESGKPVIVFDLGGMKGGHVGDSERAIRAALKVVTATAEGKVLFVMTANKTVSFTPELNRRFPDQFFFDTPSDVARQSIWPVYVSKFKLTPEQATFPQGFDAGWTGAEIKRACERAALFNESVVEASRFIVPSSVSAKTQSDELRKNASGKFLSASTPGIYQMSAAVPAPVAKAKRPVGRDIELD